MPQSYFSSGNSTTAAPAAAGSVTPDPSQYGAYQVTMPAGNVTIANPVNAAVGNTLMFIFTQDSVGSRTLTWGSKFKTAWNPASVANAISSIGFWYDGSNWQMYGPSSFDQSGNSTFTPNKSPSMLNLSIPVLTAAAAVTQPVLIADIAYQMVQASVVFATASTSGTVTVTTETATGAPGTGTAQLTAPMSLSGTINTVVTGTLVASPATLAVGDRISLLFAGTVTNLAGCTVTLTLKRCLWP